MAKVKLNPTLEGIQGKVGDLIFKRLSSSEIVTRMPNRTGIVPSASQLSQMEKFRLAALYGKAVLTDPVSKQVYEDASARKGIPAFALSVGDFLNAPAVDEVDLSAYTGKIGDKISVRASDDIEVQGVHVAIREAGGDILEEAAAVFTPASASWVYTATSNLGVGQAVVIEVSATDRPGHTGSKEVNRN